MARIPETMPIIDITREPVLKSAAPQQQPSALKICNNPIVAYEKKNHKTKQKSTITIIYMECTQF